LPGSASQVNPIPLASNVNVSSSGTAGPAAPRANLAKWQVRVRVARWIALALLPLYVFVVLGLIIAAPHSRFLTETAVKWTVGAILVAHVVLSIGEGALRALVRLSGHGADGSGSGVAG